MGVLYKEKKINFNIIDENPLENIFDNKDNSYLAIRTVSWNKQQPKLEVRRWYIDKEDNEIPSKGISFYTEEGPHQLTHLLLKLGYGDDDTIESIMKERKNKLTEDLSSSTTTKKKKVNNNETNEIINKKEKSNKFSAKNLMDNISINNLDG